MRYWDTHDVTVMRTSPFEGAMSASLYSVSDPFASSYSSTMASIRRLSSSPAGVSDIRLFLSLIHIFATGEEQDLRGLPAYLDSGVHLRDTPLDGRARRNDLLDERQVQQFGELHAGRPGHAHRHRLVREARPGPCERVAQRLPHVGQEMCIRDSSTSTASFMTTKLKPQMTVATTSRSL